MYVTVANSAFPLQIHYLKIITIDIVYGYTQHCVIEASQVLAWVSVASLGFILSYVIWRPVIIQPSTKNCG